ncbi:MAG: hypothetical protein L3J74_16940 [Bacteroidales bacterium]|nr:hypothetical protein [Bacteroidales bacterium]
MFKNIDFIKNWEETRKLGRRRYALVEGALFGFIIAAVPIFIGILVKSAEWNIQKYWVYYLGFSVLGGMLAYWFVFWPMNEYFYKKKKGQKEQEV